jgi:hypothetical protein
MTAQNIKLRSPVPFPALVVGNGGIKVTKTNGQWSIEPDFTALAAISVLADPTSKGIWIFDPVTGDYNVLTLATVGSSLFIGTSTTSVAIGSGSQSFATQPGKLFDVGSFVVAFETSAPANYLAGQVTVYDNAGNLTINVPAGGVGGSGTHADWTIVVAGPAGAQGPTGALGATGAAGANGTDPGIRWTFDTATAMSALASGALRFNNATLASATAMAISANCGETGNPNVAAFIRAWDDSTNTTHRGYLLVKKSSASQNFAIYEVNGNLTDNSSWLQISIAYVAGSGSLSANDVLSVQFFRTGDKSAENNGSALIDFGAYPGTSDAQTVITGQANIQASSIVKVWIAPAATADHSADEHLVDAPKVFAGSIVTGTGFTIYGIVNDQPADQIDRYGQFPTFENANISNTRTYGKWNVQWEWR